MIKLTYFAQINFYTSPAQVIILHKIDLKLNFKNKKWSEEKLK